MNGRVALIALVFAGSAAHAGDLPLYKPAPDWAEQTDLKQAAAAAKGPFLINDIQVRAADGTVTTYADTAIAIDSPQALTQLGTLTAHWMPDKGDLTVHRAALIRDGVEIDLLKGSRFTVLRREQQLEQRTLTGLLTATMPVSGARIGDAIRLTLSVSMRDDALKGEVQNVIPLPFIPVPMGVARLRMSWPADEAIKVGAGPRFALPPTTLAGGFRQVELPLNRKKPDEMPGDAPDRYRNAPVVQLTSFADWGEVSRTMAPLYAVQGTIAPGGPIAAEVTRIMRETPTPRGRALAALQLVQDRIAYLADGMNGGNYVPQSPAVTWETRYGDCKAKTLLLTAILAEMGIAAEPILVSTTRGDAVAESLPMPGAFDHVLVRASVDGRDLWLDGTGAGARAAGLEDVPPLAWGLPLTAAGSGLVALPYRAPAMASTSIVNRIDLSAGIDFPALYDIRINYSGNDAVMLQQMVKLPDSEQRNDFIDMLVRNSLGAGENFERSVSYNAATGTATVAARGMANSYFDRSERRAQYAPDLFSGSVTFDGNRSRAAWRDIPVALAAADRRRADITVMLPKLEGYSLSGGDFTGTAAGASVERKASLAGHNLHIVEEIATTGGEVAPANIAAERARFAALSANRLRLRAPADAPRAWDRGGAEPARIKPVLDAYARLIAAKPDESGYYIGRASFFSGIRDHRRALADLDKAIELEADAETYSERADVRRALGDLAGAIDDEAKVAELAPSGRSTINLAREMGRAGRAAEGLPLVEQALEAGGGDDEADLVAVRAYLLARLGRADEGRERLAELTEERPGDPGALNELCWFGAVWKASMDTLAADCDAAVNAGKFASNVLDSRALANLRLGRLQAALADAEAALKQDSGQDPTLLLRGVIRTRMGDRGGAADIAEALRRRPGLEREYTDYGVLPVR